MRSRSPYDPPATPGEVVRRARELAYLSQLQLAARAGLAASTLSRLESGTRSARWDLLERLLAALDLQPVLSCEPREEHLRRRVAHEAGLSTAAWFNDLMADGSSALRLAERLPVAVDGTLAARLLGLPLPIDDIELVVAREVAEGLDVEAAAWTRARVSLRPHDDGGWFSPRPERDIVLRVVDDLPPVRSRGALARQLKGPSAEVGKLLVAVPDWQRMPGRHTRQKSAFSGARHADASQAAPRQLPGSSPTL